jgi:hypothetical protein
MQIKNMNVEKWGADLLFLNWKHIKIWRERCEEVNGKTPEQIEKGKQARLLEEIKHIQNSNAHVAHSEHDWILEDIENLANYNSKMLETWIYGAKLVLKVNKTKRQQSIKYNKARHQYRIIAVTQPAEKTIEKEDLDPGEQCLS